MSNENKDSSLSAPSWKDQGYIPVRYLIVLMTHFGIFLSYWLRNNINFAIITMVSRSSNNSTNDSDVAQNPCGFNISEEAEADYEGEFDWDEWTQGLILGAFYWGYLWTQLPGGYLTETIGGRYVFGGTILMQALVTLLIPLAANIGSVALIIARAMLGFFVGALYPSLNGFISCWAPPQERTMLITICHIGAPLSMLFLNPFLAFLIKGVGWEAAFYVPAAIAFVWCFIWFIVVSDSPHNHRWITNTEKDYIVSSMGETKLIKRPPVPWRALLTSLPFWSLVVTEFGNGWAVFLLLADLPLYMKDILGEDLSENAFWTSIPHLGSMIVSLTAAAIADAMLKRKTVSRGTLRKGMQFLCQVPQGVCMLTLTFFMCDRSTAHIVFFISQSLGGLSVAGFLSNYMDIAPNFTGTINGISNGIGTTTGWLAPMTTGALVNKQQTLGQWRKVWYVASGMYFCNLITYLIFSSGEVQPWNYVNEEQIIDIDKADGCKGNESNKVNKSQEIEEDKPKSDVYSDYVTNSNFRQSRTNYAFNEN